MACECDARINALLADKNGKLAFGFSIARSETTAKMQAIPVIIEVEKINPRGKKPPVVAATFCPFCGTKYKVED